MTPKEKIIKDLLKDIETFGDASGYLYFLNIITEMSDTATTADILSKILAKGIVLGKNLEIQKQLSQKDGTQSV